MAEPERGLPVMSARVVGVLFMCMRCRTMPCNLHRAAVATVAIVILACGSGAGQQVVNRSRHTNARFKYLLEQGQTGLSTAFDMPALMGYDADHPRARGEVGKEGVSISTLDDFERLFKDIPLGDVTTSMTINCTASVALAMYLVIAEKQGVSWSRVGGTMQNDMLKEFIAQKEWICPPDPAVRIVVDMIEFTAKHVPRTPSMTVSWAPSLL